MEQLSNYKSLQFVVTTGFDILLYLQVKWWILWCSKNMQFGHILETFSPFEILQSFENAPKFHVFAVSQNWPFNLKMI